MGAEVDNHEREGAAGAGESREQVLKPAQRAAQPIDPSERECSEEEARRRSERGQQRRLNSPLYERRWFCERCDGPQSLFSALHCVLRPTVKPLSPG